MPIIKELRTALKEQGYHLLFTPHLSLTHTHTPINIKAPDRIQGDLGTIRSYKVFDLNDKNWQSFHEENSLYLEPWRLNLDGQRGAGDNLRLETKKAGYYMIKRLNRIKGAKIHDWEV